MLRLALALLSVLSTAHAADKAAVKSASATWAQKLDGSVYVVFALKVQRALL